MRHEHIISDCLLDKLEILVPNPERSYCFHDNFKKISIDIDVEDFDSKLQKGLKLESENYDYILDSYKNQGSTHVELLFEIVYKTPLHVDLDEVLKDNQYKLYGAIDREGRFYQCDYSGHNDLLFSLQSRGLIGKTDSWKSDEFEQFGFVKLTGSFMTECEFEFVFESKEYDFENSKDVITDSRLMTKEQIDTIEKYLKLSNRKFVNFNYEFYEVDKFINACRTLKNPSDHWDHFKNIDEIPLESIKIAKKELSDA